MKNYYSAYPELKKIMNNIKEQNRPVYVCNIETTGLNPVCDHIIQIAASKCMFNGSALTVQNTINVYINPETQLSEFTKNFTGRNDDFYASKKTLDEVMPEVRDFFGNDPVVLGWTANDFTSKFLMHAGFLTGFMIYPCVSIDLMRIVKSVIPVKHSGMDYKFKTICSECGIKVNTDSSRVAGSHDALDDVSAYINLFNMLYPQCITGNEVAVINKSAYWEKSASSRNIYFETNHGSVHINANNGFFVEDTPGFFDVVDMDKFAQTILSKCNVQDIKDVVKLYYTNWKTSQSVNKEVG